MRAVELGHALDVLRQTADPDALDIIGRPDQLAGILERAGVSDVPNFGAQPLAPMSGLSDVGLRLAGEK